MAKKVFSNTSLIKQFVSLPCLRLFSINHQTLIGYAKVSRASLQKLQDKICRIHEKTSHEIGSHQDLIRKQLNVIHEGQVKLDDIHTVIKEVFKNECRYIII